MSVSLQRCNASVVCRKLDRLLYLATEVPREYFVIISLLDRQFLGPLCGHTHEPQLSCLKIACNSS